MSKRKTLIITDMLNDFIRKEGALYCGTSAEKIIDKIRERLADFREKGNLVIYLKDAHAENDKEFEKFPKHCVKDTWGNRVIEELKPVENETVIEKQRYSGFYNTDLDNILAQYRPDEVYLTGVCTSICVMDTAGGLANRDYNVIIPETEIADFDPEMHNFSIKRMKNIYGAQII